MGWFSKGNEVKRPRTAVRASRPIAIKPTKRLRPSASKQSFSEERAIDTSELFGSLMGISSKAGVVVSPKSAMTYSTVFACVDLIASTISIIPIAIFQKTNQGRFPAIDHDQYYLIKKEPHKMYSRLQWTKMMMVHYLLWGDGISIIQRNDFGRPMAYLLQYPWDVEIDKIKDKLTGEWALWYKIDGKVYPSEDIIHFSDLSIDGKKGCGRISSQSETIGLGIALRDFGNELIANGGKVMGYIHGEKKMTPDAYKLLSQKFLTGYGADNAVGILPHGWKYEPFKYPLPAADAQYMDAKKYSTEEVCTIFRTHPFLIGLSANVNNSVAENIFRSFLMTTIAPITTMMEGEFDRKIFRLNERLTYYVKYNLFALDKADIEKTMNALVQAVNNGILNKDEARDTLDRNPIPNKLGEDYMQPLQIAELSIHKDILLNNNKTGTNA